MNSQMQRIVTCRNHLRELEAKISEKTKELKALKSEYDDRIEKLFSSIDQPELPFGEPQDGDEQESFVNPDAWRDVTLEQLEITGKHAELLMNAGLGTLGAIADFTKNRELTNIRGVGRATAEKIIEKLDKYWEENPRPECPEEDEEESEVDHDD